MAQVKLNIADITLALEFRNPSVAELIGEFYHGFATDAEAEGVIQVDWVGPCNLKWPERLADSLPTGRVVDHIYSIDWEFYRGHYDLALGVGACSAEGILGLSHYLWAISARLLPEHNGLLLHASSVTDGKRAFVFPAPSGTGKSTLVRNSPGLGVFSDDGVLVRLLDGCLYSYGSPFRSDNLSDFVYGKAAVEGLFFLEQSPFDRLTPLNEVDTFQRLIRQTFLSADDRTSRVTTFRTVARVCESTHGYLLQLTEGPSFWRCLDAVPNHPRARVS